MTIHTLVRRVAALLKQKDLKVVFAERPHARILAISTETALAIDGVIAVLTAGDVPYNRFGLVDA